MTSAPAACAAETHSIQSVATVQSESRNTSMSAPASAAPVLETNYPDVDLQQLPYSPEQFDYVITDQVLAHLPDPRAAVAESFRVLKLGGMAVHTTCFLNPIHHYPRDYYRISCEGLE